MTPEEILEKILPLFVDILEDENVHIDLTTTAQDVDNWDSLTHLQMMVAIEKQFKIRFTASEIEGFANVGEICKTVATRIQ